jgi:hypothetical protein
MTSETDEPNIPTDYVASIIRETDNGPRVPNEAEILASIFGPANEQGIYGAQEVTE